jgi:hypothetical protein
MPPAPVVGGEPPAVVVGGPGRASPGCRPGAAVTVGECEPMVEEQADAARAAPITTTRAAARMRTVIFCLTLGT